MSGPSFVDSNVLVYADDRSEPHKRDTARQLLRRLLRDGSGKLSLQVLQEYFSVATRKLAVSAPAARRKVALFARFDVVPIGLDDVLAAIDLHQLHALSFWDALIIRAALLAGCRRVYSEDLQHGWKHEGLEVVNPFLDQVVMEGEMAIRG